MAIIDYRIRRERTDRGTTFTFPGGTKISFSDVSNLNRPWMKCEVIYVHPKGRFHVVEFTNAHGITMRETFWGIE